MANTVTTNNFFNLKHLVTAVDFKIIIDRKSKLYSWYRSKFMRFEN